MLPQKQQVLMVAQSLLIERSSFWVAKNKWNFWARIINPFWEKQKTPWSLSFSTKQKQQNRNFRWLDIGCCKRKKLTIISFLWRAKLLTKKKTRKKNYLDFRYRWCKSSTLSWSLRIIIKYCLLVLLTIFFFFLTLKIRQRK